MAYTEQYYLAIDLGTSGAKTALISTFGDVLGWESEPIPLLVTPNGGAEQRPEDWTNAILTASRRMLGKISVPRESITAICCSSQGEGTIPVDRNGQALTNCFLWMDMRGAEALRKRLKGFINVDGADLIKTLRWVGITGGMPSITGKDPAGHMLYIKEHMPAIYAKTYKFLNVLDYINLWLTGNYVATSDSILTSWVTDNRKSEKIRYHSGLQRMLGIDREKFPDLVQCSDVIGELRPQIAEALGFSHKAHVVAGAIDNTASAIGSGAVADYETHMYIGTSSWMAAHVPFKKTDIGTRLASVPCAIPNRYLMTALQATAGGNLTYLKDVLFHPLGTVDMPEKTVYQELDRIAAKSPAGSNGMLYTPWIWGERAPVDDSHVRGALLNVSLSNKSEDAVRAVFEGVAYNTRWMLKPVESFLGRSIPWINFVGGGANSAVWAQIFADVLQKPIRQVVNPIQANARGAAWIAAVGSGNIKFSEISQIVKFQQIFEPNKATKEVYDDGFATFVEVYKRLSPLYKRLNP